MRNKLLSLIFVLLVGCSGMQVSSDLLNLTAYDVGLVVYNRVPEARLPMDTICLLSGSDNSTSAFKNLLEKVWTESSKLTNTESEAILMTINTLWGIIELKTSEEKPEAIKQAIIWMCKGIEKARQDRIDLIFSPNTVVYMVLGEKRMSTGSVEKDKHGE